MAEWKDIVAANETIRTITIERFDKQKNQWVSKDYSEVNQRIKAFRMVYPEGFILPQMVSNADGMCIFNVAVGYYDQSRNKVVLATGTAYEREGSSQVNRTSYIENCETSAVGRALGMAGFGIDTSIAGAEEMQNALNQQAQAAQAEPQHISPPQVKEPPGIKSKSEQYDILSESEQDTQLRLEWLQKYGEKAMDNSCIRRFGTGFAETPIDKIKEVMPA